MIVDAIKVLVGIACMLLAVVIAVMVVVRFVQFWIGFAEGMNEASEKHHRGFEVQPPADPAEPVLPPDRPKL
jgi:hypothetical protein